MPGATETEVFERVDMLNTEIGTMMKGEGDVVAGRRNRLESAIASVRPAGVTAELHARQVAPGAAKG
jgi:hypothetical protein